MNFYMIIAIVGLLSIIVGTSLVSSSLKVRRRYTYPLLVLGGICLLIYSLYLDDLIFIILQSVFIVSSLMGLIRMNEKYLKKEFRKIGERK